MKKINTWIKNNILKIITIFLLLQPVVDLITSIMVKYSSTNISIGIITKMLFIIFSLYYIFFISKEKIYKRYSVLIIIYIFIFLMYNFISVERIDLIYNLTCLFKYWYFPIVLLLFNLVFKENKNYLDKNILIKMFFMYAFLIIIPILFGLGNNSYLEGKIGSSGLFYSANDISAIIGILLPFVIDYILKFKNKFLNLFAFIFISFICLFIGTKVPLISLFICMLYFFIKYLSKLKLIKRIFVFVSVIFIFSLGCIFIIPKTNFYKNINIHLEFLGIDSAYELITDVDNIDRFIYSDRITFLNNINNSYKKSNILEKFIGLGYIRDSGANKKLIEIDYYDVFYANGILGFIIYFLPLLLILFNIIKRWYKLNRINKTGIFLISICLILLISGFSGHVFSSPSVSIIATLIITSVNQIYNQKTYKRRILICSNDLVLGGIEKSLITLLKNIDYNMYDVVLLLEQKKGILLNEVPNNVKVICYKTSSNKNIIVRKVINLLKQIKFIMLNYMSYDCSVCYATYSYPCNKLTKLASQNTCLFVHSNYLHVYNFDLESIKHFFNTRGINKYKKIIFVSNESMQDLINIYPSIKDKSYVISNLINYEEILKKSKEKIKYSKVNNKLFVFVGRLEEKSKKITRMINLVNNIKNIDLWIIGDGPDKKLYEKLVKESKRIKLLGQISNPYPYMRMADYIILTSDYEGYPVVYNEAIILKKKIITTISISDEYIKNIECYGYIISKEEKTMIKQVKNILRNDNLKIKTVDFKKINNEKLKSLYQIFDEVV